MEIIISSLPIPGERDFAGKYIFLKKKDNIRYMSKERVQDPLHGITLEMIVKSLVDHFGWEELGRRIDIRCFNSDPSVKSSLKFLRKTPWAREKVEKLYAVAGFIKNKRGRK